MEAKKYSTWQVEAMKLCTSQKQAFKYSIFPVVYHPVVNIQIQFDFHSLTSMSCHDDFLCIVTSVKKEVLYIFMFEIVNFFTLHQL